MYIHIVLDKQSAHHVLDSRSETGGAHLLLDENFGRFEVLKF